MTLDDQINSSVVDDAPVPAQVRAVTPTGRQNLFFFYKWAFAVLFSPQTSVDNGCGVI